MDAGKRRAVRQNAVSELSSLALDVQRLYQQYAVKPYQLSCLRDQDSALEQVFVLAKNGNRLLYFDDVEEDFGVATPVIMVEVLIGEMVGSD